MKHFRNDIIFRGIFSVAFWFLWLVLPILNAILDGAEKRLEYQMLTLPASLLGIPFFYLNAEFLAPKYLHRGKTARYFFSLAILFVVYLACYVYLKDHLVDSHSVRVYDARTLFPVIFVTGMSTLYGLITLILSQSRKAEEEKAERMRSELAFLRSQISPHFIFNILNSIVYLIRVKSENAEKVTIELSKLIRYMLYESENKYVLLEKEIEYLENYAGLQKVRFGEDVDIQIHIEGNPSGLSLEPMLLIPFVENAFKHGVGLLKDPFITIHLKLSEGNVMEFSVRNKCGTNEEEAKDRDSGIGIKNVRRRIELLYPGAHELKLREENGIFDVYLRLILKKSEK
ncbi:MAG: histidine kinase [Leadbetterella sp.]|nr:histidine kinase [Leadbetterella sp.]